jgi:hypothetical protein
VSTLPGVFLSGTATEDDIYLWWLLKHDTDPGFRVIPVHEYERAMAPVVDALPSRGDEDDVAMCLGNPLWTDPERSAQLLAPLAQLLLPEPVLSYVTSHRGSTPVLLAIAPGGLTWSQVPWELLPLPDGRRLIEAATIRYEPPAAELRDERDRLPDPSASGPTVYVIDPCQLAPVLSLGGRRAWRQYIGQPLPHGVTRFDLHRALTRDPLPGRLLYYGHHIEPDNPTDTGSAGLLLDDPPDAQPAQLKPRALADGTEVLPLTALDLIFGDADRTEDEPRTGALYWPMPPKVALIACGSGTDPDHYEAIGITTACINAGAAFVTATRWTLPADGPTSGATSRLAWAVDRAHASRDPVDAVAAWQRGQHARWTEDPVNTRHSPLLWAALATYDAAPIESAGD